MLRQPLPWPFPLPSPPLLLNHAPPPQQPQPTLPGLPLQQQPIQHPLPQQPQQSTSPSSPNTSSAQRHSEPCTGAAEPETPRLLLRPKGNHVLQQAAGSMDLVCTWDFSKTLQCMPCSRILIDAAIHPNMQVVSRHSPVRRRCCCTKQMLAHPSRLQRRLLCRLPSGCRQLVPWASTRRLQQCSRRLQPVQPMQSTLATAACRLTEHSTSFHPRASM